MSNKHIGQIVMQINGTLEDFTNWLAEINAIDDKQFKEMAKTRSDEKFATMIMNNEISESDVLAYFPHQRIHNIICIMYG